MVTISEIAKWLMDNDDIAIMSHVRPDGDSLGSTLALKLALEQLGKRAVVVYPDPVPAMYCIRSRTLKMQSSGSARPMTTSSAKAWQEGAPQEPQRRPGRWASS